MINENLDFCSCSLWDILPKMMWVVLLFLLKMKNFGKPKEKNYEIERTCMTWWRFLIFFSEKQIIGETLKFKQSLNLFLRDSRIKICWQDVERWFFLRLKNKIVPRLWFKTLKEIILVGWFLRESNPDNMTKNFFKQSSEKMKIIGIFL